MDYSQLLIQLTYNHYDQYLKGGEVVPHLTNQERKQFIKSCSEWLKVKYKVENSNISKYNFRSFSSDEDVFGLDDSPQFKELEQDYIKEEELREEVLCLCEKNYELNEAYLLKEERRKQNQIPGYLCRIPVDPDKKRKTI